MKSEVKRIVREKLGPDFFSKDTVNRNKILDDVISANFDGHGPSYFIKKTLTEALRKQRLTSGPLKAAIKEFEKNSLVQEFAKELKIMVMMVQSEFDTSASSEYVKSSPAELTILLDEELICDKITQWAEDEYAPVDERIEITNQRKVRRFDSLARILASQRLSVSVCSTVTIDTTSMPPKIVVGANLNNTKAKAEYLSQIMGKINVLKDFYTKYKLGYEGLPDESQCIALSTQLYHALFPNLLDHTQRKVRQARGAQ